MNFYDQIICNILFQLVVHKGGESAINNVKIFHNVYDLKISVVNSYTGDQMIHTFLDNFHQGGKYCAQKASKQVEMIRKEFSLIKNHYLYLTYKLIIFFWTIQ